MGTGRTDCKRGRWWGLEWRHVTCDVWRRVPVSNKKFVKFKDHGMYIIRSTLPVLRIDFPLKSNLFSSVNEFRRQCHRYDPRLRWLFIGSDVDQRKIEDREHLRWTLKGLGNFLGSRPGTWIPSPFTIQTTQTVTSSVVRYFPLVSAFPYPSLLVDTVVLRE